MTDYSFPAKTMLNLEVKPDYYFYFLGHTGQIIYFQVFGGQHIYFQKLPAPPNKMVVPIVHIALNAKITCEATPN